MHDNTYAASKREREGGRERATHIGSDTDRRKKGGNGGQQLQLQCNTGPQYAEGLRKRYDNKVHKPYLSFDAIHSNDVHVPLVVLALATALT